MQTSHQQFLLTVITIRNQSQDKPVLSQGWSIKDLLAHIGFWEARVTKLFRLLQAGQLPDPEVDDPSIGHYEEHLKDLPAVQSHQ
jgi:Mycothiol maleylpyruvate isomerase N-terminal domain